MRASAVSWRITSSPSISRYNRVVSSPSSIRARARLSSRLASPVDESRASGCAGTRRGGAHPLSVAGRGSDFFVLVETARPPALLVQARLEAAVELASLAEVRRRRPQRPPVHDLFVSALQRPQRGSGILPPGRRADPRLRQAARAKAAPRGGRRTLRRPLQRPPADLAAPAQGRRLSASGEDRPLR